MTDVEALLFFPSMALYIIGAVLFTLEFLVTRERAGKHAAGLTLMGLVLHGLALGHRCWETGYAPMTNMYESLSFFAWVTVGALLVARRRVGFRSLAAFTAPVYVVLMLLAYVFVPDRIPTLIPALQSWLLPVHVMLSFIGLAWLVIGFAAALMYLIRLSLEEGEEHYGLLWERLPESRVLDSVSYRAICLGYPIYTFGALVLGMLWAHRAWGRYWGWDPKETWALVTFLVYSLYLHGRLRWGWRGKTSAYLAILGFAVSMFTLFGVNILLSGLHSYATGG